MSGTIASPVAQWRETPASGAAQALTRLVPWLRTDGFWILLAQGVTPPVGAIQGAYLRRSDGFTVPQIATTVGLRITRNASGFVFFYGQPQLFRYAVGGSLSAFTVTRGTTAEYTDETFVPLFRYGVGTSLAAMTFTRGTTANYVGEV